MDFFGDAVELPAMKVPLIHFQDMPSRQNMQQFYDQMNAAGYEPVVEALLQYKKAYKPDDWLFYQLIRKTAQQISPKADNYNRYTLYKWWLLSQCGYDAMLTYSGNYLLFYVQSDEAIYNIPFRMQDGKQYVCLNYHDYGSIDFEKNRFTESGIHVPGAKQSFTYKVTRMPSFKASDYEVKDIRFDYYPTTYHFKVKLNHQVKNIFANYPVVDYEYYFNMPLSAETYGSLIPALKQNIKGLNTKDGVEYLMRFTRYAFIYKPDGEVFGDEKRLSPEQTLLYEYSDCEDRAGLFFYLVKEIYNLPMIVLAYPKHVTIGVRFDKPVGKVVEYNGEKYSVCEPTPQKKDLRVGQMSPELQMMAYEVVYAYHPTK
jgi:hypothetical protein